MSNLKRFDNRLREENGVRLIGGLDEAGRGALAGPVVAAVVVLGPEAKLRGVNDSKLLTPEEREALVPRILEQARSVSVALATAEEIDHINILQATLLAARRAMDRLSPAPEYLVTDYLKLNPAPCAHLAIPKADSTSMAVAAASVLAKVTRDRIMTLLEDEYPQYGFARHKGYCTEHHVATLQKHGASTIHRLTYSGVCWFDAKPSIRCRSASLGSAVSNQPEPDLFALLRAEVASLSAAPFLPEMERRLCCSAQGLESLPSIKETDPPGALVTQTPVGEELEWLLEPM